MHRIERTPVIYINEAQHWYEYAEPAHLEHSKDGPVEKVLRKDATERWQFRVALITFCVFLTLWLTRYWR